ncbi:hypothetical protein GOODEAATRI_024929 [Goodea atripinnis]|uniref:Neurabin-1/2 PDZ domain-containing protein n=1 Tax=Goodea atripinnis TaxID=208336 RepID=A0ABV0NN01_9TELE
MQVFTTYSNEDYDRRNDDVDPMAASAESDQQLRPRRGPYIPLQQGIPACLPTLYCQDCVLGTLLFNGSLHPLFSKGQFVIGREKPGEQSEVAQLIQQTLEQERWQREMMEQRYKQYMDDDEEVPERQAACKNLKAYMTKNTPHMSTRISSPGFHVCMFGFQLLYLNKCNIFFIGLLIFFLLSSIIFCFL